jgi:hypothetical protein
MSAGLTCFSSAPLALTAAAVALAVVGITMNGWFARSLGSTDLAGYLFLAVGMSADGAALVLPSMAAAAWLDALKMRSLAGWLAWLVTFAFAVTAGIGFASVNIADTYTVRAVAGMIHMIGLLPVDQLNIVGYALRATRL